MEKLEITRNEEVAEMAEEKKEKEDRKTFKLYACPSPLSAHKGHASICQTYQAPSCLSTFVHESLLQEMLSL